MARLGGGERSAQSKFHFSLHYAAEAKIRLSPRRKRQILLDGRGSEGEDLFSCGAQLACLIFKARLSPPSPSAPEWKEQGSEQDIRVAGGERGGGGGGGGGGRRRPKLKRHSGERSNFNGAIAADRHFRVSEVVPTGMESKHEGGRETKRGVQRRGAKKEGESKERATVLLCAPFPRGE